MSVTEKYTLDANILFYAIDTDDDSKHRIANQVVEAALELDCVITVQSLGELYNAISRRRSEDRAKAELLIQLLAGSIPVASASVSDLAEAIEQHQPRPVQSWDTLLWATARRHGCKTILTEDAQDRPTVGGVRYLNPFKAASRDIANYLK